VCFLAHIIFIFIENSVKNKEEFDELVAEIKKLKGVVLRQEKKIESLETRIKDFDSLIKEATTFKLANGSREDGQDSEQDA